MLQPQPATAAAAAAAPAAPAVDTHDASAAAADGYLLVGAAMPAAAAHAPPAGAAANEAAAPQQAQRGSEHLHALAPGNLGTDGDGAQPRPAAAQPPPPHAAQQFPAAAAAAAAGAVPPQGGAGIHAGGAYAPNHADQEGNQPPAQPPPDAPPPPPQGAAAAAAGAQPPPANDPAAAPAAPHPPYAQAGLGVDGQAQHNAIAAAVAAAMAAVQQNRPPQQLRIPRQLEWPLMTDDMKFKPSYGKGRTDFRSWWTGYSELTRHVEPALRALHLLTAVQDGVKLNCEDHFHAQGRQMSAVSLDELKNHIIATYEPTDGVYRRICTYVDLAQGSYNLESYIRRRQEAANTLAADAVVVPEIIERALLVRSLEPSLSTELMRKVGWWDKPVATLITEAIATDKAKRSSETRKPAKPQLSRTKSHYLSVAAGRQRTSSGNGGERKPATEALATATARQGRRQGKGMDAARAQQKFPPSTKDMQKLYSPDQWARRTKPVAGQRPRTDPLGADRDLFEKDVHPVSGKPYCISCKTTGHTLASCPVLAAARNKRKAQDRAQSRSNNRPRK